MPITYVEGFALVPTPSSLVSIKTGISNTFYRTSGRAGYAVGQNAATTSPSSSYADLSINPYGTPSTQFSVGFALFLGTMSPASQKVYIEARFADQGVSSPSCRLFPGESPTAGSVSASLSSGVIKDATPVPAGWSWWNVVGVLGSSSAGYVRFYRNGVFVLEYAPDLYVSTGMSYAFQSLTITLPSNSWTGAVSSGIPAALVADVVVRNDTVLIPDTRVDVLRPNRNSSVQWSPSSGTNWGCVDDTLTIDSDSVSSATPGALDLYGFDPLPVNPVSIMAATTTVFGKKSDAGAGQLSVVVNGSESTAVDLGTSGAFMASTQETNPSGGSAWTKSSIDTITAGPKVV